MIKVDIKVCYNSFDIAPSYRKCIVCESKIEIDPSIFYLCQKYFTPDNGYHKLKSQAQYCCSIACADMYTLQVIS